MFIISLGLGSPAGITQLLLVGLTPGIVAQLPENIIVATATYEGPRHHVTVATIARTVTFDGPAHTATFDG